MTGGAAVPTDRRSGDADTTHPRWTLAACILASSLAFLDGSVVNVALPAISQRLGAGSADLPWIVNAYLLPLSALLLFGGALGDRLGRRRVLIGGIALFAGASAACAMASGLATLLAARAVQGVGAALLMPSSLALLGSAFAGEARGRAIGTWAWAGAIGTAVGPPLGGWLVDAAGWQAIFLINLPVAAGAIAIAWWRVDEDAKGDQPLDWPGSATITAALAALTWALTGWSSSRTIDTAVGGGLVVGSIALLAFLRIEAGRGDRAMMPLSLFANRDFVALTVFTFLLYGALGGLLALLPFVLVEAGGYSAVQAGSALLPFALIIGVASRLTGAWTSRVGARLPLSLGALLAGVGIAGLALVNPAARYWAGPFPALLVIAAGMAGAVAPLTTAVLTTAVLSSVDDAHTGTASGFNSAVSRTGGLLATACLGAVFGRQGAALVAAFHAAAFVGGIAAIAAAAIAWRMLAASGKGRRAKADVEPTRSSLVPPGIASAGRFAAPAAARRDDDDDTNTTDGAARRGRGGRVAGGGLRDGNPVSSRNRLGLQPHRVQRAPDRAEPLPG